MFLNRGATHFQLVLFNPPFYHKYTCAPPLSKLPSCAPVKYENVSSSTFLICHKFLSLDPKSKIKIDNETIQHLERLSLVDFANVSGKLRWDVRATNCWIN